MEVYGGDALFRSLAVTPAYRGMGLARRFYEALVQRAVAQGVRDAYLLTKTKPCFSISATISGFLTMARREAFSPWIPGSGVPGGTATPQSMASTIQLLEAQRGHVVPRAGC